ncbi:MAG TPA: hypothetical protein VIG33_04405 [Pseudobdellovibrionaceae bacterium]|jgi:hypothetical protein
MFHFKSLLSVTLLFFSLKSLAQGDHPRWTLQEWMAQKDKNRLMDLWLSMNSPSPYELMLGISYNSYNLETTGSTTLVPHTSYLGVFSAYAQFVGLTVEYENNAQENLNDLSGLFNLRLLGDTIQGSSLTLHYGMRTRTQGAGATTLPTHYVQQFAQASIQLYVIKNFGFDGLSRIYSPADDSNLGEIKGNLSEAGLFIDFKNIRVFGTWYKEAQRKELNTVVTEYTRTGIRSGLKFFF